MEFMQSGPDIIRSAYQHWLLNYWASQRDSGSLPVWRGLNPTQIAVPFDYLAWMEVVEVDGAARFRMQYHGPRLIEALGPVEGVGRFIDDFLPQSYLGAALSTYREAVRTKGPVYTVSDMRDPTGRIVHHERLLLPFTTDGPG